MIVFLIGASILSFGSGYVYLRIQSHPGPSRLEIQ